MPTPRTVRRQIFPPTSDDVEPPLFNDSDWSVYGTCEVQEEDGTWRRATLFNLISRTAVPGGHICLYFGDEEYEGLPPNTYTLDSNNRLFDSDHDEIKIRYLVYSI